MSSLRYTSCSRRGLLAGVGGVCLASLGPRIARAGELSVAELLAEIEALSVRLREAKIDGEDWQRGVVGLLAGVDPIGLRDALALDWAMVTRIARAEGRAEQRLETAELRGTPSAPHFRRKLVCLAQDHAIVPHGHHNIASVFVVVDGRFRGRHFDRLRDEPDAIVIRPVDDRSFAPGDRAGISDRAANVHWFTALEDRAVLLNFSVTVPPSLRAAGSSTGRVYLDPDGEQLGEGLIRAPRVSASALRDKYDG